MRRLALTIALLLLAPAALAARPTIPAGVQYASPMAGAAYVSPGDDIVVRPGGALDASSLGAASLTATGSSSGAHPGGLSLDDDGESVVFEPAAPFTRGETVTVRFGAGVRTASGAPVPSIEYTFGVSDMDPALRGAMVANLLAAGDALPAAAAPDVIDDPDPDQQPAPTSATYAVPPKYPAIKLLRADRPDPGEVFIAPFSSSPADSGHLVILDNRGLPIFYQRLATPAIDFTMQPNGLLTYYDRAPVDGGAPRFYALDSAYTVVDSFATGNGYLADSHDLKLLHNHHALLLSYDPEPVRMDSVVAGGRPDAIVVGLIVQELNKKKKVVFQWRSWDHFDITDAASRLVDLTSADIDYVHGNSIEPDLDGNLLLSSRHLNEVTKIDRETGDIIWRLGRWARHNDFTFVGDPRGFSHQHDVRRLPNGHLTLFDNGNDFDPLYSRAVEYELDEVHHVATMVWEYDHSPDVYGSFMGSVERRPEGETMIGWGGTSFNPKLSDLHADGSLAYELGFPVGSWTYRAFRFPWSTSRIHTPDSLDVGATAVGIETSVALEVWNSSSVPVSINDSYCSDPEYAVLTRLPIALAPGAHTFIGVAFTPRSDGEHPATLYLKSLGNRQLIAREVQLMGRGGQALAVSDGFVRSHLYEASPNPVRSATTIDFDIAREGKVSLSIFDVHGRRVARLLKDVRPPGHYEVTWQPALRTSGVYFCRLKTPDTVEMRKLELVR